MLQTDQQNNEAYKQLEALLTWANVVRGEDGLELSNPEAIQRQLTILDVIYQQLETMYDSIPRMLKEFIPLSMVPFQPLDATQTKAEGIRKKYIKELVDKCYLIKAQVKSLSPFSDVPFIQDAITLLEGKRDDKGLIHVPTTDAFIKAIDRLTRKYKSLRIIFRNPHILAFRNEVVEDNQKKIIRVIYAEGYAAFERLTKSYVSFASWAQKHNGSYQEAKDIWQESTSDIWQKLRAGNIDSEYNQALERLVFTMSMKKFYQQYRDVPLDTDIDTVSNTYGRTGEEDENDSFLLEEEIEKDRIERTSTKIGFDLLGGKSVKKNGQTTDILPSEQVQERAILTKKLLYFGEIVKHRALVTDEERDMVEKELAIDINKLSQEFIIDKFNLDGKQSAFAHRLKGYKQKWFSNTGQTLHWLQATKHREGLVNYFSNITFFKLSTQYQAPLGNEPWYKGGYEDLRENILTSESVEA
jgi:hypothetical protein